MLNILIINGPNLNLLGEREKDKYGNISLEDIEKNCLSFSKDNNLNLKFFQSNIEGEIVTEIQKARNNQNCIIINAGGYTHTSVAIHDALKILQIPIIELHITNIHKREEFRHKSLISDVATGIICGIGTEGYTLALKASVVSPNKAVLSETSETDGIRIKSPIIGTAYLAPEPGAKKFVEVGQKIKKGQTIMIVEAMKTMNHVPSTNDGIVKKILVNDGQPVEFGQPLIVLN